MRRGLGGASNATTHSNNISTSCRPCRPYSRLFCHCHRPHHDRARVDLSVSKPMSVTSVQRYIYPRRVWNRTPPPPPLHFSSPRHFPATAVSWPPSSGLIRITTSTSTPAALMNAACSHRCNAGRFQWAGPPRRQSGRGEETRPVLRGDDGRCPPRRFR